MAMNGGERKQSMRLIDADKIEFLLPRTWAEEEKNTCNLVIKKAFENAPTVEAIPISYIKEIIEYWRSLDFGYWDAKIEDFEWLINVWEHDQMVKMKRRLKK